MLWYQGAQNTGLSNRKFKSAINAPYDHNARPSQTDGRTDGRTDRRTNIMAIVRRFVLTKALHAKKQMLLTAIILINNWRLFTYMYICELRFMCVLDCIIKVICLIPRGYTHASISVSLCGSVHIALFPYAGTLCSSRKFPRTPTPIILDHPTIFFKFSWLSYSYKLVKMLSVCVSVYVRMCVWMLTRVAQIVTAAHRHLYFCTHRPNNKP